MLTFSDTAVAPTVDASAPYTITLSEDAKSAIIVSKSAATGETAVPALTFKSVLNDTIATSSAVTLYKVDAEAARTTATSGDISLSAITGGIQISSVDQDRPFAEIRYADGANTVTKLVHFAADADIVNMLRVIYLPNQYVQSGEGATLANAVDLFHIKLATNASDDIIEIKGTKVPNGTSSSDIREIHVGKPDADNSALPDFVIPKGALGSTETSVLYQFSRIVINNGAYVNIDSDQYLTATGVSAAQTTAGNYRNGNVEVKSGGKVRDSAYNDWPLGTNSTFTVEAGGYMSVGAGNRDGQFVPRTAADAYGSAVSDCSTYVGDAGTVEFVQRSYCAGMLGWLIGPNQDTDSRIQLGRMDKQASAIYVSDGWVYLTNGSYAKIAKYANIWHYSVLVGSGSEIEIDAELGTKQGDEQAKFYGTVDTSGSSTQDNPAEFKGSTIIVTANGEVSNKAIGANSDNDATVGTYHAVAGVDDAVPTNPWNTLTSTYHGTWATIG
jgi:hypothetical protein